MFKGENENTRGICRMYESYDSDIKTPSAKTMSEVLSISEESLHSARSSDTCK